MNSFLATFLAVVLAMGLALFAYDRLVLAPRLQQSGEQARVNLDEARAEARQIAEELDSSLESSVAQTREALEEQRVREELLRAERMAQARNAEATAEAAQALMRAAGMKVALAEHYFSMGQWPSSQSDLGMGEPLDHAGGPVASITLEAEGVIAVALTDAVAPGGMLRLVPELTPVGNIEWRCRPSGYEAARRLRECRE